MIMSEEAFFTFVFGALFFLGEFFAWWLWDRVGGRLHGGRMVAVRVLAEAVNVFAVMCLCAALAPVVSS